jgi:hypothetical protein
MACTERRTNGKLATMVASVDFVGFQKWHSPPMPVVKE